MQPGQVINPQSNNDTPPQPDAGGSAQPTNASASKPETKPPKTLDINSTDSGKGSNSANTTTKPKRPENKVQINNPPEPQAKKADSQGSITPAAPAQEAAQTSPQTAKAADTPQPIAPAPSGSSNLPKAGNANQSSLSPAENNKQQSPEAANEEAAFPSKKAEAPPAPPIANKALQPETGLGYEETIDKTPLLTWQAAEFTKHNHSPLWYVGAGGATAILILVLILLPGSFGFQEWLSAVVVILMIVAFVLYARRNPRELEYALTETGILIGGKYYSYSDFHAFAVLPYHGQMSVELDPLKRFMPRISLPTTEQNLQQVEDILSTRLPKSERKPDPIDKLTHYLKF